MAFVKRLAILAAVVLAFTVKPAQASSIVLTFEGLRDLEPVTDFYNGGTGGMGSAGTNYGIQFGGNSLAIIDADAGGSGNFANEPSPSTILFFLTGTAVMNVPAGFTTGFSFFYTSVSFSGSVNVYSGLNGTGDLLTTLNLQANGSDCGGDPGGFFNCWTAVGVLFDGTAMSVDFGGTVNAIGYDDITLGSERPGTQDVPVPEPGTIALLGTGIAGLVAARLRRRRA